MEIKYGGEKVRKIIEDAQSHLTENAEENVEYLKEIDNRYSKEPEGLAVTYYIYQMIWDNLPVDTKLDFLEKEVKDFENSLPNNVSLDQAIDKLERMCEMTLEAFTPKEN